MQNDRHYNVARVVVGESNREVRQATKSVLLDHGFRRIFDTCALSDIRECVSFNLADLIICDADMTGCGFCETVRAVRERNVGDNPFVLVLALTSDPTDESIKRLVNCGADDIMLKPLKPGALLRRIEHMIGGRQPFVVTHCYIGPDRRTTPRPDDRNPLPRIEVPNPLRSRVLGEMTARQLQEAIDKSWTVVNEHRMERHSVQIQWLLERIMPALRTDTVTSETVEHLDRLLFVAQDLSLRLKGTRFDHVGGLAVTLVDVIRRIQKSPCDADPRAIGLLPRVADAITAALSREHMVVDASRRITETVSRYTTEQRPAFDA
ncbi:MAG: response regulator [Alphaproteobacteria bacterium]